MEALAMLEHVLILIIDNGIVLHIVPRFGLVIRGLNEAELVIEPGLSNNDTSTIFLFFDLQSVAAKNL